MTAACPYCSSAISLRAGGELPARFKGLTPCCQRWVAGIWTTDGPEFSQPQICATAGCDARVYAREWCGKHYKVARDNGVFVPVHRDRRPPVCICDEPAPDAIGECQRCFRPYRQETFAETRAAWRAHLGMDVPIAASHPRGNGEVGPAPGLPGFAK